MIRILFFLALTVTFAANAYAANLRGYVEKCSTKTSECYPASLARVQLYYSNGSQWVPGEDTYAGKDGFYFFYDVAPGLYYIKVNKSYWYQIRVTNAAWQDVQVLRFEY